MNPLTHIVCGGVPVPADAAPVVLLDRRPGSNLHLDEDQLLAPLMAPPTDPLRDLLDIAAYVYAADQAVPRGANPTSDGDHGWRRSFDFRLPVRCPDLWATHAGELAELLGFLSDDDYEFAFAPPTDPAGQTRMAFGATPYTHFDDVALFSGGLDSLAGAAELVAAGRQPLLITHRPITKIAGRQARLLAGLGELAGDRRPVPLAVRVNKDSSLTRENTQRSRSFLYAALGGLVAATVGMDRLLVFENGPLSLNLPPTGAAVGGRATRTTHPRALAGFARLLTAAAGRPFAVENPFRDRTKTDVVTALIAAGGRELIRWSTSCVHTHEMSARFPHCGRCSQCLDRRFAVLAAGAEADDPADGYRVDVATGDHGADGAGLLAGYVAQATEIDGMANPVQFFARYGEVVRALDGPDPAAAAERVYGLYRRHAGQVVEVVDRIVAANAAGLRARTLPAGSLARLVCGDPPDPPPEPVSPTAAYLFVRLRGDGWRLRYAGGPEIVVTGQKGFEYLHHLLARPNESVQVAALTPERVARESEQTALDRRALADLRERLAELDADIADAQADHDPDQEAVWRAEREAILAQVQADTRPGGKLKKVRGGREKQREAVRIAIRRACATIAEYDRAFGEHLTEPRLVLGATLLYSPPDGVAWQTAEGH